MAIKLPAITLTADALDFWDYTYKDDNGTWQSPGYIGNTFYNNPWSTFFLNGLDDASQCPGLVDVRITRQRAIDKKKPAGSDVGTVTIHGINPAEFDIDVLIWTPDQWVAFKTWLSTPRSRTSTKTVTTQVPSKSKPGSTTTVIGTKTDANGNRAPITQTIPQSNTTNQTKTVSTSVNVPFLPKAGKNPPVPWNCYHPVLSLHGIGQLVIIGMTGPHKHSITRSKIITLKCVEWAVPATGKKNVTNTDTSSHGNVLDPAPITAPGQASQNNVAQNQKSGSAGSNQQQPAFYNAGNKTVSPPKPIGQ